MNSKPDCEFYSFPAGMTVKPLYDQCPKCGCDLEEFYKAEYDQAKANSVKNETGNTGAPASVDSHMRWKTILLWMHRFMHWMVNPLSNAPDDTSKTNHKGFFDRIFWKKTGTIEQNDKSSNDNDHLVPSIKRKSR